MSVKGKRFYRKYIDEPVMSDKTLLVSVEDLIAAAFGPFEKNTVNFKLVQTILHILARQLRLLEQDVEIKFDEIGIDFETGRSYSSEIQYPRHADKYQDDYYDEDDYDDSSYYSGASRGKEADRGARKGRGKVGAIRDRGEKEEKEERGATGHKKEKIEKHEKGEKEKRDRSHYKGRESKDRGTSSSPKHRRSADEGVERAGRGGQHRRGEHDKDEGGERGSPGRQHDGPKRRDQDDKDEGGEKDGPRRSHGGSKRRGRDDKDEHGERDGPGRQHGRPKKRGEDDKDEGEERDSPGRQHGRPKKRGEDDKDEGEERDSPGRQHGRPKRRGEDDKDEGEERDSPGRQHGRPKRRGEDDKDEGEERDDPGRQHGRPKRRGEDDKGEGEERDAHGRHHGGRRRRGEDDGDEGDEQEGRRYGGQSKDREDRDGERRGDRRGKSEYDEYDDQGQRRLGGREGSGTSITVTEAVRKGGTGATDKVLVAERGPAKHGRVARVGSIEVVTASQFALLDRAVRQLEHVTGPLPEPALPDNKQLRADLATGRASLSDTMEAVQLNKRVQAAEEGLSRMAGLLTQLTAAGALPSDFASRIGDLRAELRKSTLAGQEAKEAEEATGRRAFAFTPGPATGAESTRSAEDVEHEEAGEGAGADKAGGPGPKTVGAGGRSTAVDGGEAPAEEPPPPDYAELPVTHTEMQKILEQMKEALTKEIQNMTARANHSADMASSTSRNVSEKLNIALTLDERITTLYAQTADYTEQLNGFDTGLTTQMASFQEQMSMMRSDLQAGLELLESANNNAETTAILDLSERYQNLVIDLDTTVHLHSNLSLVQQQIGAELKSLVECVEMLREQKADRDEVLDGLRDKADITRLSGLLYEKDFAQARFEIEKRIQKSYEKFDKQDLVWQVAMRDLTRITEHKAELIALMALKDQATKQLNALQAKLRQLETMLGEPQAALLTRTLAAGAACGACLTRAVMPMEDATHGKPALLPALLPAPHPAPPAAELPCLGEVVLRPPDTRNHICHRWVGGSHTLLAGNVLRERAAQSHLETTPLKKYEGYGSDGRLYMMEEEMQPCGECNKFSTDEEATPPHSPTPTGAGDQKTAPRTNHP